MYKTRRKDSSFGLISGVCVAQVLAQTDRQTKKQQRKIWQKVSEREKELVYFYIIVIFLYAMCFSIFSINMNS